MGPAAPRGQRLAAEAGAIGDAGVLVVEPVVPVVVPSPVLLQPARAKAAASAQAIEVNCSRFILFS
jgi:hypothetical protein